MRGAAGLRGTSDTSFLSSDIPLSGKKPSILGFCPGGGFMLCRRVIFGLLGGAHWSIMASASVSAFSASSRSCCAAIFLS